MPRISTTEANQALVTTNWDRISLHTGDPSTTGANEVTGGSYARQTIAWNSPASGTVTNSGTITFSLPSGSTATYFGLWSAGGVYYIGGALNPAVSAVGSSATVTITAGSISVTAS